MNRREAVGGGVRNGALGSASVITEHRRPRVRAAVGTRDVRVGGGEELDLFSRNRRSVPASSDDDSDGQIGRPKLGSMPPESPKVLKSGVDDILSGVDMGKHDYDWLLTPPGTPITPLMNARDHEQSAAPPIITSSLAKSVAPVKASRFSVSQTENGHSTRPARSSSLTRPSVSSSYSGHFSSNNKPSVLNTSMSSVTSYNHRPLTPTRRPTTSSTTNKQASSVPSSRASSRPSTPSKIRPSQSSSVGRAPTSTDRSRPLHASRPSTPTNRPQISVSLNSSASSIATRSISRPSTPTRRTVTNSTPAAPTAPKRPSTPVRSSAPAKPLAPARPSTPTRRPATPSTSIPARSTSVGRVPVSNGRNSGPSSRPSSPSPRLRTPVPIALTDFALNAPPNLRTKLPERPLSAGRTRSGGVSTGRGNMNSDASAPINSTRRKPSPILSRDRLPDNSIKNRMQINGHEATPPETQKVSDGTMRKLAKPATTTESTGFGRNISKKSLDMALRHMDIRQGIRGASLFPQSIRSSAASKGRPGRMSDPVAPFSRNGTDSENNDCGISISGSYNGAISENDSSGIAMSPEREIMKRATAPDIYESTRYDTILMKEDSKNMNWLHSIEDKSDQSPVFDHRFEPLPEPFALP